MGIAEKVTENIIISRKIRIEVSLCSQFRTPKSGCTLCSDTCPAEAISVSEKGAVLTGACTGCGICTSVCPNGVFRCTERTDTDIIDEIRGFAEKCGEGGMKVLRISCEWGDGKADILLPCLGRLTEAFLLEPLRSGFSGIDIIRPECSQCENARVSCHVDAVINRSRALYEMVNRERGSLSIESIPLQSRVKSPEKKVSRREFFSRLRGKAAGAAAASLPDIGNAGKETAGQTFSEAIQRSPDNYKRKHLLSVLEGFPAVKEVYCPSTEAPLADIEVSSHCTACGVCAILCPVCAITQKWDEGRFYLHFKPSLCTNCGVCVKTCMPQAIKIGEKAGLHHLAGGQEIPIFTAESGKCAVCRFDFIRPVTDRPSFGNASPGPTDICPLCQSRREKQMAFIQNGLLRQEDTSERE